MIAINQIISIIFRLLNFGVLIGLFVYFFKKYIKDMLISQIAEKKRQVEGLEQERDSLAKHYRVLSKTVKKEQATYRQLQQAVKQWHTAVEQEQARRAFEKNYQKQILKEKAAFRVEQVRIYRLKQQVLPSVLKDAQVQLQRLFDDSKMGNHFIQRIITHMQKGKA